MRCWAMVYSKVVKVLDVFAPSVEFRNGLPQCPTFAGAAPPSVTQPRQMARPENHRV